MTYTYAGTIEQVDGDWLVSVPAFDGCFGGGDTLAKACTNAAEALRLAIASSIDGGSLLPKQEFDTQPQCVLVVEVTDEYVATTRCMTIKEAARELGVSISRVSQLLTSGGLEAYEHNGERLVTIASVNDRMRNPPAPHRPRKEKQA